MRPELDWQAVHAQANLNALRAWFAYEHWSQGQLTAAILRLDPELASRPGTVGPGRSVGDALAHLVHVQRRWFERWVGDGNMQMSFGRPEPDVAAVASARVEVARDVEQFLRALRPLSLGRPVRYVSRSNGQHQTAPLWTTLMHAVQHAQLGRQQVQDGLTQIGSNVTIALDAFARDLPTP